MTVKKMDHDEWRAYVQRHLDERKERSVFFLDSLFRMISVSLVIGIIASLMVIIGWGFHEWTRMMLQVLLTATFATTVFGAIIRRLERKYEK